jgi:hypothetical protein
LQYLRIQPNTGATTNYQFAALPTYNASDYNFPAQTPGGSLIAQGSNQSITLSPCPLGVASAYTWTNVYLSGGTGTAEPTPITGGTCTSGATSGTITVTPAYAHSGAWTVGPVAAGIQEAANVAGVAGGGTVLIGPSNVTMLGTVTAEYGNVHFQGAGKQSTILYRNTDYGHTFVVGSAASGSITDVQFLDLEMTYDMGPSFNGSGQITSITRKPTVYPASAHIYGYGLVYFRLIRCRLQYMPYELVSDGGAYSSIEDSQFQGLWDYTTGAMQVTVAALYLTGDAAPHGSTQGFYVLNSDFFGFNSPSRNVTINGGSYAMVENIGPEYMIQMDYVEVVQIKGGLNGGGGIGIYSNPTTYGVSGMTITGVHFDGNRVADGLYVGNSNTAGTTINVEFTGNDCQGSGNSASCIVVASSTGARPLASLSVSGNMFSSFFASALSIQDGVGISIGGGNTFRNYNYVNAYGASNQAFGASAINIGGNAADVGIAGGNIFCGGTNDLFGLTISNSEKAIIGPGRNQGCIGSAAATEFAFTAILPANTYASGGWNYVSSETGAANAIVGSLPQYNGLYDGTCVTVNLAHNLQAGANTFSLNTSGVLAIKSHLNPSNNIAAAYTAPTFWLGCYKAALNEWLDMSQ